MYHYEDVKGILSAKNGMNIYRGCQHGCIYCDARSSCYCIDHAFEDILVKQNALVLLEAALSRKRKKCMIGTGSMSDPYMPLEKHIGYTRRSLEIIERYGFGATILTKSDLVLRDLDLIKKINRRSKFVLQMTLTTFDEKLCSILEPNVATTKRRYEVLKRFKEEGIPTVVWFTPILPFINDTEENIEGIIEYCHLCGVDKIIYFGAGLTLRDGNREYYYANLDRYFPFLKDKYIRLYGDNYIINSPKERELSTLFKKRCQEYNICFDNNKIFNYLAEYPNPEDEQLTLF